MLVQLANAAEIEDTRRFSGNFSNRSGAFGIGTDLHSPPDFEGGLIIFGDNIAIKIGGLAKADFIGHLSFQNDWGRFQTGGLYRIVCVQPTGAAATFDDDVWTGIGCGWRCRNGEPSASSFLLRPSMSTVASPSR